MKKIISIILSATLIVSIITPVCAEPLTGTKFIQNVKNIAFNNEFSCKENIHDTDVLAKQQKNNIEHSFLIGKTNKLIMYIILHKKAVTLDEAKILAQYLINKGDSDSNYLELIKKMPNFKEYSPKDNEYLYTLSNVDVKQLGAGKDKGYVSLAILVKTIPNEKKTFVVVEMKQSLQKADINTVISSCYQKVSLFNTNKIVKKISLLSKKTIKHLNKIKKLIKKNKPRNFEETSSYNFKKYAIFFSTEFKKKSKYKNVFRLFWVANRNKNYAKTQYKTLNSTAKKAKLKKPYKRKIIKIKDKKYKAKVYLDYNKKNKRGGVIVVGLNTKTNVVVLLTVTAPKRKLSKKSLKAFNNKYIKFAKKILKN